LVANKNIMYLLTRNKSVVKATKQDTDQAKKQEDNLRFRYRKYRVRIPHTIVLCQDNL